MKRLLASLIIVVALLSISVSFTSIAQKRTDQGVESESAGETAGRDVKQEQDSLRGATTTLIAFTGQISKTQVESPLSGDEVEVINRAKSTVDVDFIAIDMEGNEVSRETEEVGPKLTVKINLQSLFPELLFSELSIIEVQSSARPMEGHDKTNKSQDGITALARELPIAFFSQRDPRWANDKLGTCDTTIGKQGCAISCVAMAGARSVYNFNPASLNTYLKNNKGYSSGCLINWGVAANIDGSNGFTWLGTGTVSSAANLKSYIDGNKFVIAKSKRFSSHFGIIYKYEGYGTKLSDFVYLDPWDTTATFRRVNDGWITAYSETRIYK